MKKTARFVKPGRSGNHTSWQKPFYAAAIAALSAIPQPGTAFAADAASEKQTVSVNADLPLLSAYVWRGQVLNDEAVFQPSITVSKGGFTLNVAENVNLTNISTEHAPEATETDLTFSYTTRIESVAASIGWIEYLFSNQPVPGTREVFVSAGLPDLPGSPTIAAYHDFKEINGTYFVLSTGYSKTFDNVTIGLSGSVGYGSASYNKGYFGIDSAAFNDLTLGLTASIKAADNLTVTPIVQYVTLLDSDIRNAAKSWYKDDRQVVFGLKVSYAL